jgi:limonene-1,2-epoxide hydrolase
MAKHTDTLHRFLAAWSKHDIDTILTLVHEDVVYQNMPFPDLIKGREGVRAFASRFAKGMSNVKVELRNVVEQGDVVMHEGWESYDRGDTHVRLPYAGVFEFRDGLIVGWRDYFDWPSLDRQLKGEGKAA